MNFALRSILFCFLCLNAPLLSHAQDTLSLNQLLVHHTFEPYKRVNQPPKRKLLFKSDRRLLVKLNPLSYLLGGLMYGYQNVLSEQIAANCTYEISCSEFTKRSIERHGVILGTFIGLHQLSNCSSAIQKDYPAYMISEDDKIKNRVE